jgi:SAM-dependent MidA family methyltransferase
MSDELRKLKNKLPISIDNFIEEVLYGESGYYTNNVKIGKDGDFITSPCISSLFGQTIALYVANYIASIRPNLAVNIIEFGAGNGDLFLDFISFIEKIPSIRLFEVNYFIVEKSKKLIDLQQVKLIKYLEKISWIDQLSDDVVDENSISIFFSNELLDSFTVKQFKYDSRNWFELFVDCDESGNFFIKNSSLESNNYVQKYLEMIEIDSRFIDGDIIEIPSYGIKWMEEFIKFFKKNSNNTAIFIDYGLTDFSKLPTIQSLRNHSYNYWLDNIFNADITHLVPFYTYFKILIKSGLSVEFFSQRDFLINNGIFNLKKIASGKISSPNEIDLALKRLTEEDQMGNQFKVMQVCN